MLAKIKFSFTNDYLAILVVILATDFAPPLLRMLGDRTWIFLGLTESQWSVFTALRGLFFIVFVLIAGVLGDLLGRRRMLLLTLAAYLACVPIMLFAPPISATFLVSYSMYWVFGMMARVLAITFVLLKYEGLERMIGVVIYSIVLGISFLLAPVLARLIGSAIGFNAVFLVPLLLTVLAMVMTKKYIVESKSAYDVWWLDAIVLAAWALGVCLIIFAVILMGALGASNPLVLSGLGIGAVLILAISWLSGRPISEKRSFRLRYNRQLGLAIYLGVIFNLALFAITVQVFNFLNAVQNIPPILSGIGLAPIAVGAIISVGATRWTVGRGLGDVIAIALVLIAIPALSLSLLQPELEYWVLVPGLILVGFGYILGNAPRLVMLFGSVPRNLAATVQAIGNATGILGSSLAYSFMITLIEYFGMQAYLQTLASFGLDETQISIRLTRLAIASEEISLVAPTETQTEFLQQIDQWIVQAYTIGLSRAMLVLAALCLVTAAGVYLALRKYKITQDYES